MNYWHWFAVAMGPPAAVACETLFRMHQGNYGQIAAITLILAMITNYSVFHVMKTGDSLIEGIVIWSCLTATLRVLSTLFILKESPRPANWIAFSMIIGAVLLTKLWR